MVIITKVLYFKIMVICCEKYFCGITIFIFILIQVATALLVAGSAPTFWIPPFVSTSSYSSVVQSARLLVELQAAN